MIWSLNNTTIFKEWSHIFNIQCHDCVNVIKMITESRYEFLLVTCFVDDVVVMIIETQFRVKNYTLISNLLTSFIGYIIKVNSYWLSAQHWSGSGALLRVLRAFQAVAKWFHGSSRAFQGVSAVF